MLTTSDNPYDPFTDFDGWYQYDEAMGYHSCAYLGRVAKTASTLPDEINDEAIEDAIDSIVALNGELNRLNGAKIFPEYVKVIRESSDTREGV